MVYLATIKSAASAANKNKIPVGRNFRSRFITLWEWDKCVMMAMCTFFTEP
jgi:hypothetical protein